MKRLFLIFLIFLLCGTQIVNADVYLEIVKGNVPGNEFVHVHGVDENVGTTTYLIWGNGDYLFPLSATLMNLSSSSIHDTNGGSGVWNVTVYGLDSNWERISETVILNGTSEIPTILKYRRINKMMTEHVGSDEMNNGTIYIGVGVVVAGVPNIIYNEIIPAHGESSTALYTVPLNHTAYIYYFSFGTDSSKIIELSMKVRCEDCPNNSWVVTYHDHYHSEHVLHNLPIPFTVTEKSDIGIYATNTVGSAFATVDIFIILVNNDYLSDISMATGSNITIDPFVGIVLLVLFLLGFILWMVRRRL